MKKRFIKNLYQNLSNGGAVLLFDIILIAGGCISLTEPQPNGGWIMFPMTLFITMLFFFIGFYWIFKVVDIGNHGITIKLLNKTIRDCPWSEILSISKTCYMKNPALKIVLSNEDILYLDDRKSIIRAIEHCSGRKIT